MIVDPGAILVALAVVASKVAVLVALVGSFVAIPATSALAEGTSNPNTNRLQVPVSGVVQSVGTFAGTFSISKFAIQNQALVAIGQLTGTVTDSNGTTLRTIVTQVAMPVSKAPRTPSLIRFLS